MPAKSKKQQMAAGAALAAKRGKRSKSSLRGASRGMYKSMSKADLRRMAKTKRKGKPTRKKRRKEFAGASRGVEQDYSSLLRCSYRLPQRFQTHSACPGKGMVEHVDQKQNRRDHDREGSGNQVLRPDVFHSEEKCVGHREYAANKYDQPDNWRHGIVPRKYSHSAILSQVIHTSQRFSVELSVGIEFAST